MRRSRDVLDLVATQLGSHEVESRQRLVEDLGAESADLVNLIASLEDRYGISIGEEEAAALETVADVEALVARLLEGRCRTGP